MNSSQVELAHHLIEAAGRGSKDVYAHAYIDAGLSMNNPEELRVQILYILNNLSGWRGDEARTVKAALKKLAK